MTDKMSADPHDRAAVIDYDQTFTDSEKKLFEKISEFPSSGDRISNEELNAQIELVVKADQILLQYAIFTLRKIFLTIYSDPDNKIDEWYFNHHFFNFLADLMDCLQRVHTWQDKDRDDFLKGLEENGLKDKFYRLPRGSSISAESCNES